MFTLRRLPLSTLLLLPLGLRADWLYRQMPKLPASPATDSLPPLSIVVPARNEAENLRRLLPSLNTIRYPGHWEVIVVDDDSTDSTAAVAEAHGARVIRLGGPPAGWLGKPHACHQGAAVATGGWLLFTDADTVHAPDGPANAVAYAQAHNLDGLSLFLIHETGGWAERLALMVGYAGLFAGLPGLDYVLNGQFILLRRDVYEGSGGHAAVRDEELEDLAFAQRFRTLGCRVPMLRGEEATRVRMYRGPAHVWQGLTRMESKTLRWLGPGAVVTALFTTWIAAPLATLTGALIRRRGRRRAVAVWLARAVVCWPWAWRLGSGWWALLAPAGAALVQIAGIWGLLRRLLGRGASWKQRIVGA